MEQRGVTIEEIDIGDGDEILRGDRIRVCYDLFLRRGDAVETGVEVAFKVGERRVRLEPLADVECESSPFEVIEH